MAETEIRHITKEAIQQSVILPLAKLKPNNGQIPEVPANPRKINKTKFEQLKTSILDDPEMLSLREVLIYQHEGENVIIGGNMRYRALKALGYKEAICKIIAPETSAKKLRAIALKDNNNYGEFDMEMLANEWSREELDRFGIDLPPIADELKEDEAEEDNFNPADAMSHKPKAQEGDIYRLGKHRLICGDSTDGKVVDLLMGGQQADLFLTDPPYNVDYSSKNEALNAADKGNRVQKDIANDSMDDNAFQAFLYSAFSNANAHLKPGGAFYIWHAGTEGLNFKLAVKRVGWELKQILIWVKNNIVLGRQDYQWKHEPCLYGWKEGSHNWYGDRKQTTVIDMDKPNASRLHPTMKPVQLFAYEIQNSTKAGDKVLDLFGGSGTTLIACEQLNRTSYLMELDPRYVDVIIDRWEKMTGEKAVKINAD